MAIRAHIKHFLNAEGMDFFSGWFEELQKIAPSFEGFIAVKTWPDESGENIMNIFIDFENLDLRAKWVVSAEHKAMVKKLDPYRTKSLEVVQYEI